MGWEGEGECFELGRVGGYGQLVYWFIADWFLCDVEIRWGVAASVLNLEYVKKNRGGGGV